MRTFRYHYFVAAFLAGAFACFAWAVSSSSVGMAQAGEPARHNNSENNCAKTSAGFACTGAQA